jgi:hypothetical protein
LDDPSQGVGRPHLGQLAFQHFYQAWLFNVVARLNALRSKIGRFVGGYPLNFERFACKVLYEDESANKKNNVKQQNIAVWAE